MCIRDRGCMGSQFENNEDPFIPLDNICQLEKIKYLTNHYIAKKYNFYELILSDPLLASNVEANIRYVISLLNELENEHPEYMKLIEEGERFVAELK